MPFRVQVIEARRYVGVDGLIHYQAMMFKHRATAKCQSEENAIKR